MEWKAKQQARQKSENSRMFWEAGTGEEREGKGMGAKLLFMTARNEQLHHTSLALTGLGGLIIQTSWVFLRRR